ncbi:mandelate racemase/muconate lactonizing enzyme family protein [Litorilinea aerophila]|uniref:Mandelate racemase/muconate lactonizing enzyme family protein n=1 Tax=Litorilinea aerophila TaxID=1204385 RepID=A0A540VKZ5_9CHLR|nr:mandelate racemase/muconate lactonizing enzyme family protein [Litorilinea aerophila]MCC9075135.1 mandelate racemase/muconate lactonizing enzyme family protein [Litorilinea aerophila]GIV78135.1 MAG: isomerase [Litorilinea sp.]
MQSSSRIKITDIRLVRLRTVQEVGVLEPAWNPGGQMPFTVGGGSYVEIHTDSGLVGIGPGLDPALLPAVKAQLVGQDPFDTERHLAALRYYATGPAYRGSAGVDIALWDLIGKACGQPLYKLFGGGRDKVPAYASMVLLSTPAERAELAARLADEGWQAIKLRLHHATMAEDIETVTRVRDAVGDRMAIMVDANQAQSSGNWQPGVLWDYRRALETARELDRLGCYWLEEPLPRYAFKDLARLNQAVAMPLAGGENNRGIHEFVQMLEGNVYDILQPEGMVGGGLTELRKIGVLAEAFGKKCVPHHGGRGLGTIAHLHLVASWPHAPYLELLHDPPIGDYRHGFSILLDPPVVDQEGLIAVPQKPGLGVEVNPDLVEEVITV